MIYQVRYDGGAIAEFKTLEEALQYRNGDWDKVSWACSEHGRLILYGTGPGGMWKSIPTVWEWRTSESLKKEIQVDR